MDTDVRGVRTDRIQCARFVRKEYTEDGQMSLRTPKGFSPLNTVLCVLFYFSDTSSEIITNS